MINAQENTPLKKSRVDYKGFTEITNEVNIYRQNRLISFDDFLKIKDENNTLILDTRSKEAYEKKHIKGAIHLNFSDFTEKKLAQVIPSKNTRILIYCNNNIDNDEVNFPGKIITMALNIPTFINLYGYGYRNIYELSDLLPESYIALEFEGTSIKQ
ncbi:rhodanese-like domain-containing protein [Abyssalbus ytuae]|uniref:Rhodanese-like domain-containing protein n=1 Tax=Abyssalbus ytuae TaxID=2926907 RepID=A0A9E6ZWA9_9FLAO|nr:rhodanese-like domain-containing protein [Abyssalbus ytuae]UOB18958.1 rhodanese-like domain-containing protein [Abyssalbus ytuae]